LDSNILIVDDEADVATYMATVLRAHGHTVAIAKSVKAGFESMSESRPDLICLDIMMPRESGISMYRRLKKDRATASIPVIVVSGVETGGRFDLNAFLPDETIPSPECFLEKPVKVEELVATVERLLSSGKA